MRLVKYADCEKFVIRYFYLACINYHFNVPDGANDRGAIVGHNQHHWRLIAARSTLLAIHSIQARDEIEMINVQSRRWMAISSRAYLKLPLIDAEN